MPGNLTLNTTVFDLVFPNLVAGENMVLCPFHAEKTPSMAINTIAKVFNCFGCGIQGNENDFVQHYFKISRDAVAGFKEVLFKSDSLQDYLDYSCDPSLVRANYTYQELVKMGISELLLQSLNVGVETEIAVDPVTQQPTIKPIEHSTRLIFPIICEDRVLDTRSYTIAKEMPKTKSKAGAPSGLILPYHHWIKDSAVTVICEGEKDMLFARQNGYNAISLGGCNNIPHLLLESFRDKFIYIVYDNDAPGRAGALKLAAALLEVSKNVYIANIGEYVKEDKEDITDFFYKYNYTKKEFDEMLNKAVLFDATANEKFIKSTYPKVSLNEASTTFLGKIVRSDIQVMATYEDQYSVPSYATVTKVSSGSNNEKNKRAVNTVEYWNLTKNNFEDILILTDNNLKKGQICENIQSLVGWGVEEGVKVHYTNPKTIFKACVADNIESVVAQDIKRTEFICYSDEKLEAGKNYQLIYKIVPHPYKGQQQVLVALSVKESADTVTTFEVSSSTIPLLQEFQSKTFTELVESQKSLIKFNVDSLLLTLMDLWYHTPATFSFGNHTGLKGYLDGLIVTESRVGKSSTAKALTEVYGVGAIASLAGSSATPAGLIGGSVRAGSSSQIRPGLIPRSHRKALVFEELAKAKYSLMPELTDVRSSGLVRITRSTGDLVLPASVRMLFLSNPKPDSEGVSRPINAYPNGLEIVKDLVGSVEDIARFDFIYVLGADAPDIDPMWMPPKGFSTEALRARIRWVWSRKENQIKISSEVQQFIVDCMKTFNDRYLNSTKIFSTETWKKITRLAIAVAGYMVSADPTFENIVVTKSHVKIACTILMKIYDNDIFKLRQFTDEERKKMGAGTADINMLTDLRKRYPAIFQYISNNNIVSKSTLYAISGLEISSFNEILKELSMNYFIEISKDRIIPTPKLLIALRKIKAGN